jgi:hypothetical protein
MNPGQRDGQRPAHAARGGQGQALVGFAPAVHVPPSQQMPPLQAPVAQVNAQVPEVQ